MAKIIEIKDGQVTIAKDDDSFVATSIHDIDFQVKVGDEVEVYEVENRVIVNKSKTVVDNINANVNAFASEVVNNGNKRPVSKWPYVILAWLIGGIGAHHFYAGRTARGLVYLIFCWTFIPGLIAFVEMIMAIVQKEDANGNIWV